MSITTTTQITAPVNVIYQANLLRRIKPLCPYFVGATPAEISGGSGSFTAKWRRYEHLTPTTTPLVELTGTLALPTRTGVQPSVTDITATVAKYGNYMILTEEVELLNITPSTLEFTGVLGDNAGRSLNRLQRNVVEDNTTSILSSVATTATNVTGQATASGFISRSLIAQAVNTLNRNDARRFMPETRGSVNVGTAPVRESYWAITHPDVEEDIRNLTGFNSVETYAGQTETQPGEFGHVGGVRFIATTESTIDAGLGLASTASTTSDGRSTTNRFDRYNTIILGQDAIGSLGLDAQHIKETYNTGDRLPAVLMIAHGKGSGGVADPLNEVGTLGWKSWHAGVVLNGSWVRNIIHSASRLTAA